MGYRHQRQLVGLLATLVLPTIAIAWLGWTVLVHQHGTDRARAEADIRGRVSEISADVRERLNRIKEQEIATGLSVDGYSDPSVTLVAWAEGFSLVLPWESLEEPDPEHYRRASKDLERVVDETMRMIWALKQPGLATVRLRSEIQKPHTPIELDILRNLLRLALTMDGRQQEAYEVAAAILKAPSHEVDGGNRPLWQTDAAAILLDEGVREKEVLARIEEDLDSPAALARWSDSLRDLLVRLRKSRDRSVARRAESELDVLNRRIDRLEQLRRLPEANALKAAFPTLGVTPETWPPFPQASGEWFVGMGPQREGRSLVVAVRAADIARVVESDWKSRGSAPQFQLSHRGATGSYRMGDSLPGWHLVPSPLRPNTTDGADWSVMAMSRQQWFYALSLALILGLTFFGGHMLWRDTRRETRMAEMRSQFVSSVSHELKTPLTGIRMMAETLQIPGVSDAKTQAEYLETIVGETERLTRLLNNVLDFSKIERGQKSYHMETTSLADVLSSVAQTMRFPLAEHGFALRMDISSDVPAMRIDRDAIEQAVLNLVSNAMRYSGEGRMIDIRLAAGSGRARIQVSDQGVGIPLEERKRIFERFYRVQTPQNRAISGTGLGLALVAHIVEAHAGRVDVESVVGKGSTFTIDLPIDPAAGNVSDSPDTIPPVYDGADRSSGAVS